VAPHVSDLLHWHAGVDEPAYERGPEDVDTASVPAEPSLGGMQRLLHDTPPDQLAERGDMADEHFTASGHGSLVEDVIDDRFAGCWRERKDIRKPSFPGGRLTMPSVQSMSSRVSRTTSLERKPRSVRQRTMA
jgi:hypothetical protein